MPWSLFQWIQKFKAKSSCWRQNSTRNQGKRRATTVDIYTVTVIYCALHIHLLCGSVRCLWWTAAPWLMTSKVDLAGRCCRTWLCSLTFVSFARQFSLDTQLQEESSYDIWTLTSPRLNEVSSWRMTDSMCSYDSLWWCMHKPISLIPGLKWTCSLALCLWMNCADADTAFRFLSSKMKGRNRL